MLQIFSDSPTTNTQALHTRTDQECATALQNGKKLVTTERWLDAPSHIVQINMQAWHKSNYDSFAR